MKAWDENGEGMYTRDGVRVDLFFPNLRNFWYFHQKKGRRGEENVSCDNDARSWLLRMNSHGRRKDPTMAKRFFGTFSKNQIVVSTSGNFLGKWTANRNGDKNRGHSLTLDLFSAPIKIQRKFLSAAQPTDQGEESVLLLLLVVVVGDHFYLRP